MKPHKFFPSIFLTLPLSGSFRVSAESTASTAPLWPLQSFKSTSVQAPYMNVTKNARTELGYIFISPHDTIRGTEYPMIYADDGQLIWRGPSVNVSALQPQMLDGEPVLAYWDGYLFPGFGFGGISILNSSYDEIYRVTLPGDENKFVTIAEPQAFDSYIDIHESQITPEGTILVTAVNVTQMDLSPIGGPVDGWVQDGLVYEIDIKTNKVLFRWSAIEHLDEVPLLDSMLPLEDSGWNLTAPYEYPHLNSVAKYGDSYLVSSRFMCSLFFIDKDGHVIWHLHGQKGGDFTLDPEARFCYQHDARFITQMDNQITLQLHNNANTDYTSATTLTTGLVLALDMENRTVSAVRKYWDAAEPVFAQSQGSYQNLTNGHVLLQHGATPKLEEFDEQGALVMRARFGFDNTSQSYRGYKASWVGRPRAKPDVFACAGGEGGQTVVYVSWNGATDVQGWRVMTGHNEGVLREVKTAPRNGFETRIQLDGSVEKVVVMAVGGVGDGTKTDIRTVERC
ncbi:ASST-domain-containing protein [Aspergillus pseudoustus]|uniref:ASST-domain-containing protein n=1 Tax=Aspergillus pseudoustus TaxID=1810923 RepID=A0ABR4JHT3_9EURO